MNVPETLVRSVDQIFLRYPPEHREAALIPVMFEVQNTFGHISPDAERWIAEKVDVSLVKVREVLTFYAMFHAEPVGKYLIQFCHNIACCLAGAENLQTHIEQKLGIHNGQTTPDGLFTLKYVECLGGCAWGPMMLINQDQYYRLTPQRMDQIVDGLRNGQSVLCDEPTPLTGNVGEGVRR